MKNIKLTLAYDGTDFLGWQDSKQGPSIESKLQYVLNQLLTHEVTLQAASRTDRGVHAEGQVVNFFTSHPSPTDLLHPLNRLLPPAIRCTALEIAPPSFHPSLDVRSKTYIYRISACRYQAPKERLYSWHVPVPLDLPKMQLAAGQFIGTHDFSAFSNEPSDHPLREITDITMTKEGVELFITVTGNSFLYKMVRNIVGTLVDVGTGKRENVKAILESRDRREAGVCAPAHGLTLSEVFYEKIM